MIIQQLIMLLKQYNLTLASCESLTAGLFASSIVEIAGASEAFKGGFITYNDEIKQRLAQVPQTVLNKYGAISKETAYYMASNTQKIFATDVAVSFTGNAGPTGQEDKPVGLCYIGVCYQGKTGVTTYYFKDQTRDVIRKNCVIKGIENILKKIKESH